MKLTIITVYARGRNWSALVLLPADANGQVRMSFGDQVRTIEQANGVQFPGGTLMRLGGV